MPASWTTDPERMADAHVPADVVFATKPALATQMITDALEAGIHAEWVAADEVYGADPHLRATLADRGVGYVLAVACNRQVPTAQGPMTVEDLVNALPKNAWDQRSAGKGAKGPRYHHWAWIEIDPPAGLGGHHGVLARRTASTGQIAYFLCHSPTPVPLGRLVTVAARRWKIEESFQACKELTGLDEHQVRTWTSWHRWTTLAMWAHALLVTRTLAARPTHQQPGLIPLTLGEHRRLTLAQASGDPAASTRPRTGHTGADDTNTAPAPPTTNAGHQPNHGCSTG